MFLIKYSRVLILGSGPSGCTASIYLSRSGLNPLLITGSNVNGQLINTDLENWPGFTFIKGSLLMNNILNHIKNIRTEIIFDSIYTIDILKKPNLFFGLIFNFFSDFIIVSTGSKPKYLFLKNEIKYFGKNISFCSICDGNFYKNKKIAIVGGGNSSIENSLYLSSIVKKIILIHRSLIFKADFILINSFFKKKNIIYRLNFFIYDLIGDFFYIKYIKIKNKINNILNIISIDGLFVFIGNLPNSNIFLGQLLINIKNYIITYNHANITSINGVFACGDIHDCLYKQAIISSGSGCSAALDLINYYNIFNF
ncbi:Thioredoxin reductase [Candidatus Nasuia deltocephalinicola]|nr:Thioredoxin reductase [Candidatus Nasuia deltocephalinicola]